MARRRRPLTSIALGAVAAWAGLELLLRVVAADRVGDDLRSEVADLVRELPWESAAAPRETFVHPYLGYETVERHTQLVEQLAFLASLGPGRADWAAQHYVVLLVGGSVARFLGDPSLGGTEPLAAELRGHAALDGREPFLLSAGRQAFKQPQQLLAVGYLLTLGIEPDLVINLDGFNEVALGAVNVDYGLHPAWPSHQHSGHLSGADVGQRDQVVAVGRWIEAVERAQLAIARTESGAWSWSAVARCLLVRAAARETARAERAASEFRGARARSQSSSGQGGLALPAGAAGLESCLEVWRRSSIALAALCAGRGIAYLHVLQPALGHDGSKPPSPTERDIVAALERDSGWQSVAFVAVRSGFPRLRAAAGELQAAGVRFVDATDVFADRADDIYYDLCHFHRPGTELLGQRIGREVVALVLDAAD